MGFNWLLILCCISITNFMACGFRMRTADCGSHNGIRSLGLRTMARACQSYEAIVGAIWSPNGRKGTCLPLGFLVLDIVGHVAGAEACSPNNDRS